MMTWDEFYAAKERLLATYGADTREAGHRRTQELSRLYAESGRGKEELAEVEHVSVRHIERHLLFGRFLLRPVRSQICDIPEWRFRGYWKRTDKIASEEARFAAIDAMIDEAMQEPPLPTMRGSKRLANQLLEHFADQRWHNLSVIYKRLNATTKDIDTVLDAMRLKGSFHTLCERRRASKDEGGWQYKITKHYGQRISYGVLVSELAPILQGLKEQGQKNMATMSPGSVAILVSQLERVLDKLAQ